jgi:TPR repeat protein
MNKYLILFNFYVIVSVGLCACVRAQTLEDLFEQGRYDEFLPRAKAAVAKNDTEALFLLGKAYHLGKGVEQNDAQAGHYYDRAREQGSARASHNLGLMLLESGRPHPALELFQEALKRGLRMPTLRNLGRAQTPPDSAHALMLSEPIAAAGKAGDYYAQAYDITSDVADAFSASRQYTRAYMMAMLSRDQERAEFNLPALRKRALTWLQKGMDKDFGPSWANYGALLLDEKDFAGARTAFEKGAAQRVPEAHFHLARMAEKGLGLKQNDPDQALVHYEQAALLGLKQANEPARNLLSARLASEADLAMLEKGIQRMEALLAKAGFKQPSSFRVRLEWGRFLQQQQREAKPLPNLPIVLQACGLGPRQTYGAILRNVEHLEWDLYAYGKVTDWDALGVSGRVNARGCVEASAHVA